MKLVVPKGSTGRILTVFIQANNVTTGAGLGSLDQTSSIVGGYVREGGTGVALAVDENVTTEGTYQAPSSAAHVRIGTPANMRAGTYELHFHNDLWATGAEAVSITLGGASNMADLGIEVQLSDPVRGLGSPTALPNAAAEASGGLPTLSAAQASNGTIQANVHRWLTGTPNGLSSGRVEVLVGAVTAGVIAAASFAANALDSVWSTATRILTAATNITSTGGTTVPQTGDSFARIGATGSGLTSITSKTDNLPSDPADASDIAASFSTVNSTLATIAGYIDTEITTLTNRLGAWTGSGVNTVLGAFKALLSKTASAPSDIGGTFDPATDSTEAVSEAVALKASQSSVDDLPTNAELTTALAAADDTVLAQVALVKAKTDNLPPDPADASDITTSFASIASTLAALNNLAAGAAMTLTAGERNSIADAIFARSLGTEAVSADGAVPTFAQAMFEILSGLFEFDISGTTITCKKRDGSTALFTSTLNSSTAPTSRTRAT